MYEIESRVFFLSEKEVFERLPFLKNILNYRIDWETSMLGIELFKDDRIFRFSKVQNHSGLKIFIGYKEQDIGRTCNIRAEIDEEITQGYENSKILQLLKIDAPVLLPENFLEAIGEVGYNSYMSFSGYSLLGKHKELSLKLMFCKDIEYHILLEIETSAESLTKAYDSEKTVTDFILKHKLNHRIIAEEPTTLLYKTVEKKLKKL